MVCVVWMHDVWWVFSHNGITQRIIGSTGTYTYRDVAPDELNLNKQSLEQTDCVKGPKKKCLPKSVILWYWFLYLIPCGSYNPDFLVVDS